MPPPVRSTATHGPFARRRIHRSSAQYPRFQQSWRSIHDHEGHDPSLRLRTRIPPCGLALKPSTTPALQRLAWSLRMRPSSEQYERSPRHTAAISQCLRSMNPGASTVGRWASRTRAEWRPPGAQRPAPTRSRAYSAEPSAGSDSLSIDRCLPPLKAGTRAKRPRVSVKIAEVKPSPRAVDSQQV